MVIPLLANQGLTPIQAGRICKCSGGNAGQGACPRKSFLEHTRSVAKGWHGMANTTPRQSRQDHSETRGQERKRRPPTSEASRKFLESRN